MLMSILGSYDSLGYVFCSFYFFYDIDPEECFVRYDFINDDRFVIFYYHSFEYRICASSYTYIINKYKRSLKY